MRGSIMAELRERSPRTLGVLARAAATPMPRATDAVRGLHRDGVVEASRAALDGKAGGRVSLPD